MLHAALLAVAGALTLATSGMISSVPPTTGAAVPAAQGVITGFAPPSDFFVDSTRYNIHGTGHAWSVSSPNAETLRFEVRSGERAWFDPDTVERSEISSYDMYDVNTSITVSYSFSLEAGLVNTAAWMLFGQFHQDVTFGGPPPFAIELDRADKMLISARFRTPGSATTTHIYPFIDDTSIQRGRVYTMVINAKFANDNTGFLNVWRDGIAIVQYEGPLGYGTGVSWKEGIYRANAPESVAVTYQSLQVGIGLAYGEDNREFSR